MRLLGVDARSDVIGWAVWDTDAGRIVAAGADYPIVTKDVWEARDWTTATWEERRAGYDGAVLCTSRGPANLHALAVVKVLLDRGVQVGRSTVREALGALGAGHLQGGCIAPHVERLSRRKFYEPAIARAALVAIAGGRRTS